MPREPTMEASSLVNLTLLLSVVHTSHIAKDVDWGYTELRHVDQLLEVRAGDVEDAARRQRQLVRTNLNVLRGCDCLSFIQDGQAPGRLDTHITDAVLRFVPARNVSVFVNNQGAQVALCEAHDVADAIQRVETYEGADQNLERNAKVVRQFRSRGLVLRQAGFA